MTNSELFTAIINSIRALADTTPLSVPGKKFSPPGNGIWWELSVFPNDLDLTLSGPENFRRGIAQVNVCAKVGYGLVGLHQQAEAISAALPKASELATGVVVSGAPYTGSLITLPDRIILPVSIPYSE